MPRGLTLFEVLISLAIFVGSVAVISQLLATGVRGAVQARLETEAIFRAESKLAEVAAGVVPFQNSADSAYTDDANWTWSVNLEPGPSDQLFLVEVTAAHHGSTTSSNVSFSLSRFVRDPQLMLDAVTAETEAETE